MKSFAQFMTESPAPSKAPTIVEAREQDPRWDRFQAGDHVHLRHSTSEYDRHPKIKRYGVVSKNDGKYAHVDWEDGSKSKHRQTSGAFSSSSKHPDKDAYGIHELRHNEGFDPVTHQSKRMKNDEHRAHLAKRAEEEGARRDHQRAFETLKDRMSLTHHSHLKPEHIKQINAILDGAKKED